LATNLLPRFRSRELSPVEYLSALIARIEAGLNRILDALAAGETPETVCDDNLLSLAMVDAAVRSSRERRTIELDDVLAASWWSD